MAEPVTSSFELKEKEAEGDRREKKHRMPQANLEHTVPLNKKCFNVLYNVI